MPFWLLKTEPSEYSYADLERDRVTVWQGISNNLALMHLRSMKKGDLTFIYHTGDEKTVVGIAEATSNPYPDPKQKSVNHVVIDLRSKQRLKRHVTLAELKREKAFASFALVRLPRLSVMPVPTAVWNTILTLSEGHVRV